MAGNNVRVGTQVTGVGKSSSELDKLRDKFDKLQKQGAKGFAIGAGFAAGAVAINAVGSAASATADFIGDSIEASRDLGETISKSRVVFGESSDDIEAWGSTTATAMGISKQAAIDAAGGFGALFTGLDIGKPKAAGMSKTLVNLAGDLASFYNMDPGDALLKLQSGLSGEAEPLRRVGVFLTEAKVKAKAMEMGLAGLSGEVSEAAKVQARYQLILEETTVAQGDAGRTIDQLAGQQRVAAASLIDAQAELGRSFEPMALQFTEWQLDFIRGLDLVTSGIGRATDKNKYQFETAADAADRSAESIVQSQAHLAREYRDTATDVATDTARMADKIDTATGRVEQSWEDMVDALSTDVGRLIDEVYDPSIQHAELAAIKEEHAALGRVIANKNSTNEEIRDAKRRRRELSKQADETRLDLLEAGELTQEETKEWLGKLERAYKTETGAAKRRIGELIAKIKELALVGAGGIDIDVHVANGPARGSARKKKARGGPVAADEVYMVGEEGPELFVSNSAGSIIPNDKLPGSGGSPVGFGGDFGAAGATGVFHLHVHTSPGTSPGQAREIGEQLGPPVIAWAQRNGLLPRNASPQR